MKLTAILEAQTQFDQATAKLERLDAALEQQRAALATVTGDDAELAALKRERQRLLADRQLAEGEQRERLAGELADHDRRLAEHQATVDEVRDTCSGLEAERERLAAELIDIRRRLADERHAHIVETLGKPALDGYLIAAGKFYDALVEVMALQRLDARLFGILKGSDPEGARDRRAVQFLRGDINRAELPRPHREFIDGRDLTPLPPERPNDNWQFSLWTMHELEQRIAARERELIEQLRQQGIKVD